jgi:hypothetical protein
MTTAQKLESNGCTIIAKFSRGKNGVISYQNKLGELWTAMTVSDKLTDIMLKSSNELQINITHNRWVSNL